MNNGPMRDKRIVGKGEYILLVCASSQPAQAQETALLRASKETQEKREEQLLRATAGKQE